MQSLVMTSAYDTKPAIIVIKISTDKNLPIREISYSDFEPFAFLLYSQGTFTEPIEDDSKKPVFTMQALQSFRFLL